MRKKKPGDRLLKSMKTLMMANTVAAGGAVILDDRDMIKVDVARTAVRATMAFIIAAYREELGAVIGADPAVQKRLASEVDEIERRMDTLINEWHRTLN